jgi:hypothetical protein
MALPALPVSADTRSMVERVNRLIQHYNLATTAVPVANLISAADAGVGARALVTDASAITGGSVVAGGGALFAPVISDGTVWRVG